MKKKNRVILGTLLGVLILCTVLLAGGLGLLIGRGLSVSTGRCLVAANARGNQSYMIILDGSPVVMSDRSKSSRLFDGLATGDEILVVHDGIQETYPGGTGAYLCLRLSSGSITNIPPDVTRELTELGWLGISALTEPPSLMVVCGDESIEAIGGNYSWNVDNGDGTASSVIACGAHPLDGRDYTPVLEVEGDGSVLLQFGPQPTSITVQCWSEEYWGDTSAASQEVPVEALAEDPEALVISLMEGGYIYEVSATWDGADGSGGTASYVFCGIYEPERTESGELMSEDTPDWGLTLTAADVTSSGLTVVYTQSGGAPTGELNTGSYYTLDKRIDGEWVAMEYREERQQEIIAWTTEAWILPLEDSVSFEQNWEWLYGELPAGQYRIGKDVMDFRETGDYNTAMFYAEFEIK